MADSGVDRFIRRQTWLERVADVLQKAVAGVYGALGRPGRSLQNLMHGTTPLGHPLHPAITDLPMGAWAAGVVADYVAHFTNALPTQAGDVALAVGLSAAVLAALTGLTDYQDTIDHERRVATAHGLTMVTAVVIDAASLALRWWAASGAHPLAVGLATAGLAVALGGGYLGGHLVFGMGTMVNRNAFTEPTGEFVSIGATADFPEGELKQAMAGTSALLAVRLGGEVHVIGDVCSHAGGPLHEGSLDGDRVTCPWHGSQFCVRDGRVRGGPATFDQPVFTVRESGGEVAVRSAVPGQ